MDLFPYEPVGSQREIVSFIRNAVQSGRPAVIESGTGTGKTVCALTGALEASLSEGLKVVFLTRTKSQQKQVMAEVRAISSKVQLFGMAVQGRSPSTCPLMATDPELASGSPEELSRLCSEYKRMNQGVCACQFFANIATTDMEEHKEHCRTTLPTPEEFAEYCIERSICPYETTKHMLPSADVIAAPYSFVFMPRILNHFLSWAGVPLERLVFIVDEAHNLPDYLREVLTFEHSDRAFQLAGMEAESWNDPDLHEGITVTDLTAVLREILRSAVREFLVEEDGMLEQGFVEQELMSRLSVSSVALDKMFLKLMELGEEVREHKKARHKLPRSYMGSMGEFMKFWMTADDETHIKVVKDEENPSFQAYCLDPRLAAEPMRLCRASVHMSGTLEPLGEYVGELGLPDAATRVYPSPFPPENLMVLHAEDVTTKYEIMQEDPGNITRIEDHVVGIANAVRRNTAVFLPSYALMDRFIEDRVPERMGREVMFERRGMPQGELMDTVGRFCASDGAVIFAVSGGRISEGLDFPDKAMELAILVGIPYPKRSVRLQALVTFCEYRFGEGWKHAVQVPAVRKMRQSIGRLIRSPTDRGAAIILDWRVGALQGIASVPTEDPEGAVGAFFGPDV